MRFRAIILSLITTSVLCSTGCRESNSLTGKVTYNGEPVEKGSVRFASADGSGPGFGAQVVNGQYKTEKIRPGKHIAYIRGLTESHVLTKEQSIEMHENRDNRYGLPVDYIPESADGNGQTVEIKRGEHTLDFDLKGPPRS